MQRVDDFGPGLARLSASFCLLLLLVFGQPEPAFGDELAHGRTIAQASDSEEDRPASDDPPLVVDIYPGERWQLRTAPLATDPLQKEPVSATVYDKEALRDARLGEVDELVTSTPGLLFTNTNGNGQTSNISLRGAAGTTVLTTAEFPVGIYVDGVYIPNPAGFDFDLLDIARVEVLRGPQGFDGGRSNIAGAIRIDSVQPQPNNEYEVQASYGNFNFFSTRATANLTSEDLQVANRLTGAYTRRDGTVRNFFDGEKINNLDNWGIRNQLSGKVGSNIVATLSFDYADFSPTQTAAGPIPQVRNREVEIFDTYEDDRKLYGGALTLDWIGGNVLGTSITALRGLHYDSSGSDFSNANLLFQGLNDDQRQLSQELRFYSSYEDMVDWVGGTYFFGQDLKRDAFQELNNLAPVFGVPFGHRESSSADQRTLSGALFGDSTWHILPGFDLLAGLRVTYDYLSIDYSYESNDGVFVLAPPLDVSESQSEFNVSPKLGLSYVLAPDASAYVVVSRGYKPGGYNSVQVQSPEFDFKPETATNYEVGLKSTWFEDRLVANASAYYFDWRNQQVQSFFTFALPTVNADRSVIKGVELFLSGRPIPGADLLFGYTYADAKFEDFDDFPGDLVGTPTNVSGNSLPFAPEHTVTAAAQYIHPVNEDVRLFSRVGFVYKSRYFFDPLNSVSQSGFGLLDARVGLEGDNWGLYLWGKNLTNTKYLVSALDNGINGVVAIVGDPRTYGVEAQLRF